MSKRGKPTVKIDFKPELFHNKGKDWLWIAGLMLLGALAGMIISLLFPPQYEAAAKLTTNLEVVKGTNVTEIMVDAQVDIIGTLVFHPDVVQKVHDELAEAGLKYTADELINKTKIERQLMSTLVKVRDRDPEIAAKIASAWVKTTFDRLNEAYPHALALSEAKATQVMIKRCIEDDSKKDLPFCLSLTVDKAKSILDETEKVILAESPLSLGLTSELNVSQYQPAPIPTRPVEYQRSILILAGALVGLVSALMFGELFRKENKRDQN